MPLYLCAVGGSRPIEVAAVHPSSAAEAAATECLDFRELVEQAQRGEPLRPLEVLVRAAGEWQVFSVEVGMSPTFHAIRTGSMPLHEVGAT